MSDDKFANIANIGAADPAAAANAVAAAPKAPASRVNYAVPYVATAASWFSNSKGLFTTGLTLLFYTSVTVFVLFLLLVFIHYILYPIFSFSEEEGGLISIPTASDKQAAFTGVVAASDVGSNLAAIPAYPYTVSFDMFVTGQFVTSGTPRVVLYRARVPHTAEITVAGTSLHTAFTDTNLLVWLDPIKNDLYVGAVTNTGGNTSTSTTTTTTTTTSIDICGNNVDVVPLTETVSGNRLESTRAIENVPVRKPFRVTIVCAEKFLEVYINGKLEQSRPLVGKPIAQEGTHFYPPPTRVRTSVQIANMLTWNRVLKSRECKANGEPIAPASLFSPVN